MPKNILILCGGRGSRIKDITTTPKVLIEYKGRPFLHYLHQQLKLDDERKVILATGYGSEQIIEYCSVHLKDIQIVTEEIPLGTGGAIVNAIKQLDIQGDLIVINGDTIYNSEDIKHFLTSQPSPRKNSITLATFDVTNNQRYGEIKFDPHLIIEKPKSITENSTVFGGIVTLDTDLLRCHETRHISFECMLSDLQLSKMKVDTFQMANMFLDFGTPEAYLSICQ